MLFGFHYVDPLTGNFDGETYNQSVGIPERMRPILRDQDRPSLDRLIFQINQLLDDQETALKDLQRVAELHDKQDSAPLSGEEQQELDVLQAQNLSDVQQLFRRSERLELEGMPWSALFAAFALALLNAAVEAERYYAGWGDKSSRIHEWRVLFNVTTFTNMAHEASAFAQAFARAAHLKSTEEQNFKQRLSRSNQEAAYKRHAPTQQAILAGIKLFLEGQHPTYVAAAQALCETQPDLVRHLAPTNRLRTLAEGIGQQLKRDQSQK